MRPVYAIALWAALGSSAIAQEEGFVSQMREVNEKISLPDQQLIRADTLATLQAIAKEKSQCVPTGVEIEAPTPATAVRLATQGIQSGQLRNAWMAYGSALGCTTAPRMRFVILLMSNGEVRVRMVNQGESIASMSIMRDTSAAAAVAAFSAIKAVKPECDGSGMAMLETRVLSRSADLSPDFYGARYRGSWMEGWTFEVCGRRAEVPVSFSADGNGGAYSNIKSADIHVLE